MNGIVQHSKTKIINVKTKEQVRDKREALEVKREIGEFVKAILEKKKAYEAARYCC